MKEIALLLLIAAALLFAIMVVFTIKKKKRKQTKAEKQHGKQSNAATERVAKPDNRESLYNELEFKEIHEGMVAFCVKVKPIIVEEESTDKLWGFADKNHKIVIEPKYVAVSRFHFGVALVRNPDGNLCFIDNKGNRVPDEDVPGHFDTLEHEERDPDRLYVAKCFIFNSGEVFVYEDDTFSYSGCSSDSFCRYIAFYSSRKEYFDLQ